MQAAQWTRSKISRGATVKVKPSAGKGILCSPLCCIRKTLRNLINWMSQPVSLRTVLTILINCSGSHYWGAQEPPLCQQLIQTNVKCKDLGSRAWLGAWGRRESSGSGLISVHWLGRCILWTLHTGHPGRHQKYIIDSLHVLHSGIPRSFKGLSSMCICGSECRNYWHAGSKYAKICLKWPIFEALKWLPGGS